MLNIKLVTRVVLDLIFSNPVGAGFGDNSFFGSQSNTPDKTSGVSIAVSCNKEAVQFEQCFFWCVTVCQFLTKFVKRQ